MKPHRSSHTMHSNLLCYVEGDPWPELIERMATARTQLASSRSWLVEAPAFVNESVQDDCTVGVVLRFAPTTGGPNDLEVQRLMFGDMEALISWAERLSVEEDLEFGFEVDGVPVGWVEGGCADKQLVQNLIEPWRSRVS